jgi:hypothetical protein
MDWRGRKKRNEENERFVEQDVFFKTKKTKYKKEEERKPC